MTGRSCHLTLYFRERQRERFMTELRNEGSDNNTEIRSVEYVSEGAEPATIKPATIRAPAWWLNIDTEYSTRFNNGVNGDSGSSRSNGSDGSMEVMEVMDVAMAEGETFSC